MHPSSVPEMKEFSQEVVGNAAGLSILEIGSRVDERPDWERRTFRKFFRGCKQYVGLDIREGCNVDVVVPEYRDHVWPFEDGQFDVVISGHALEHMRHPWKAVAEAARVTKVAGKVCLIVPWSHHEHGRQMDYWRVLPAGMRVLLEDAGLVVVDVRSNDRDTIGIARKP